MIKCFLAPELSQVECFSGISPHSYTLIDIALEVQGAIYVLHRAAEVTLYREKMVFKYSVFV